MIVVFEGTAEEYWQKIAEVVDQRIQANESKKVSALSYTEACRQLGITNKTLMKIRLEMNLTDIYQSDINRILLQYPKYIKRAKAA